MHNNPCDQIDELIKAYKHQYIPFLIISVSATLVVTILTILFLKNRNLFPIKERSPLLSVASLISLYVTFIKYIIPLVLHIANEELFQGGQDTRVFTFVLFYFGGIGFANFLFCNVLKQLRLIIAVKCKYINNGILNLFKSEVFLIKISLLLSISYACFMETWRLYQHYEQICVKNSQIYYVYDYDLLIKELLINEPLAFISIYVCLFLQGVFLFCCFQLRNLKSEYNLQREQIQTVGFLVLVQIFYIFEPTQPSKVSQIELIFLYYCTWILFSIFIAIAYVQPLLKSRAYHQSLTTSEILQQFELFIQEDYCVDAFEKFLNSKIQLQESQLANQNFITPCFDFQPQESKEVLNFYFHVKQHLILNKQEIDIQFARSTINKFKNKSLNIFEYLSRIDDLPQINSPYKTLEESEICLEEDQPKDIILLYFTFAREFLQKVYKQYYSQTISFHLIKRILDFNEKVNRNLEKLKMTEKNQSYQF